MERPNAGNRKRESPRANEDERKRQGAMSGGERRECGTERSSPGSQDPAERSTWALKNPLPKKVEPLLSPPLAMIIVTKPEATEEQVQHIIDRIKEWGLKAEVSRGAVRVVIGVIGPEDSIREKPIAAIAGVESVTPVLKPYKLVAREFRGMNSKVKIGNVVIGGNEIVLMSGPCSVESREQITSIAGEIKKAGAKILRGGAFKPRTSPYSFQGLGVDGLKLLAAAREETGLPVITEIMDTKDLDVIEKYADCLQVGARNMQNFALLKEVGRSKLPVMLKRGMSATIKDLLMSAEYILSEGNFNVLLCERGIRTFETYTRNTLDLNAVPVLKAETHLPVVVDPTHGIGLREHVASMALAAVAAGADAIMTEVHNSPELAKSDGEQALLPDEYTDLVSRVRKVADAVGRSL
jgi:3-deoxy-7-phosphoheptulonate synthase